MPPGRTYEEVVAAFRWRIPERFNIGVACSDEQVAGDPAVIEYGSRRRVRTFGELAEASSRLANALAALGVTGGRRVGLLVPQSFTTAAAQLGISKAGAVALPLSELFGPDALRHRLADSGARVLIVAADLVDAVAALAAELGLTLVVDGEAAAPAPEPRRSASRRVARLARGSHRRRRPGVPDLHVGHDGRAEGRAPRPPRALRPPARLRALARLLPHRRRRLLDAGRLGLDRRADGRADPDAVPRPADRGRAARPLRPRAGGAGDRRSRRAQRVHPADGAAADEGRRRLAARRHVPHRDERRRVARRRHARLGAREPRRHRRGDLRPDRGELPRRELAGRVGGAAGLDGAAVPGPRRRRDRRARSRAARRRDRRGRGARARPGGVPRVPERAGGDSGEVRRPVAQDGRPREPRLRRVPVVQGPRRRPHHLGRVPDLPRRGRAVPAAASGGGRGGGRRGARTSCAGRSSRRS